MAALRSQNGFIAAKDGEVPGGLATITPRGAPDSQFRVRAGDVADVFQYIVDQYQARVEDIDLYTEGSGDDWGYNFRPVRGQKTGLSNHSSGTAIDINATRHPLGTSPKDNFTDKQLEAIKSILREVNGAVRFGGFYTGRKDPMHWEICVNAATLAGVAKSIREKTVVSEAPPVATAALSTKPAVKAAVKTAPKPDIKVVSVWQVNNPGDDSSKHVYWVQKWLISTGAKIKADGYWGAKTQAALDNFRADTLHYKGDDAKGEIGLGSLTALRDAAKSTLTVREGK